MKSIMIALVVGGMTAGCVSTPEEDVGTATSALSMADTTHTGVGSLVLDKGTRLSQMCSGVLISPTVFLTAGHCADSSATQGYPVYVTFDQQVVLSSPKIAVTLFQAPDYNPSMYNLNSDMHDVGVAILATPVTDRPIATLPTAGLLASLNPKPGTPLTVVGYGVDQIGQSGKKGQVYTNDKTRDYGTIKYRSLTAWIHADQVKVDGACFGDSGGPAYMTINGVEQLVGVGSVVNGYDCNQQAWYYALESSATRAFLGQFVALP